MSKLKIFFKENWLLLFAILYLIVPTDILPDIIPIVGKIDDSSVMLLELLKRYLDSKSINETK